MWPPWVGGWVYGQSRPPPPPPPPRGEKPSIPQAAPKGGKNSGGGALWGRPGGGGGVYGQSRPPAQGGHIGPPLHAPPLFQNRGASRNSSANHSLFSPE